MPGDHRNSSETAGRSAHPSGAQESSQQPLTPTEKAELQTAGQDLVLRCECRGSGTESAESEGWLESLKIKA